MSKIGREIVKGLKDFVRKLERDEPVTVSHVDSKGSIVRRKVKPSALKRTRKWNH